MRIKGIVSVIKENGGSVRTSQLSKEYKENIAELSPVLYAAKILGLITINGGILSLAESNKNASQAELNASLKASMQTVEPFKSVVEHLKRAQKASTSELFDLLVGKGFITIINRTTDIAEFRRELMGSLVRIGICRYEPKKDSWKLA